jgi:hypothetical protein
MLFQLRLVSDRRTREESIFAKADHAPDLVSANESAIIVEQPDGQPMVNQPAISAASADADQQFAQLLPKMNLEIRAALDQSLQKEIAALRGFIGTTLDSHAERLQGDLATLLPATRIPELDLPTVMPERRSWGAITGWSMAFVCAAAAAFMTWLWWNQGGETTALRTDLAAAYAELEALRAAPKADTPAVVSPTPAQPEVAASAGDPNAVLPGAVVPDVDGPDAAAAAPAVELVPTGAAVTPPAAVGAPTAVAAPANAAPATAAPANAAQAPQPTAQAQ